MSKKLAVPYASALFTVILPTAEFLLVFIGLPLLLFSLLGWDFPDWLAYLSCGVSLILGLVISVLTYSLLLRLAARGQGELELDGDRLRWRSGRRWRQVDLSQPHQARLAAGQSGLGQANASVSLAAPAHVMLHLHGAARKEVLQHFPAPYFVDELAVTPKEGLWGFEFHADDAAARDFFFTLLDGLWRNRQQNSRFQLYLRYPWDRPPRPAFRHIRLIETAQMTAEEKALIDGLLNQFVDGLDDSCVRLTPDYLVGWVYRAWKSTWSGQPDYYCLMPLGHITAEVSLPRPDWQPFVVGQVLRQAASLTGAARGYGPSLQDKRYLYVRGKAKDGSPLELAFDWYDLADDRWEEAEMFVRFVNR
jgi:hypothetical protein